MLELAYLINQWNQWLGAVAGVGMAAVAVIAYRRSGRAYALTFSLTTALLVIGLLGSLVDQYLAMNQMQGNRLAITTEPDYLITRFLSTPALFVACLTAIVGSVQYYLYDLHNPPTTE